MGAEQLALFGVEETSKRSRALPRVTEKPPQLVQLRQKSAVQVPLTMEGLYDTSARLSDRPRQPKFRSECASAKADRRKGFVECEHLRCRYNMIGAVARLREPEALTAWTHRLTGEWRDSCVLDVADDGPVPDQAIAMTLGTDVKTVERIFTEAKSRFLKKL